MNKRKSPKRYNRTALKRHDRVTVTRYSKKRSIRRGGK